MTDELEERLPYFNARLAEVRWRGFLMGHRKPAAQDPGRLRRRFDRPCVG